MNGTKMKKIFIVFALTLGFSASSNAAGPEPGSVWCENLHVRCMEGGERACNLYYSSCLLSLPGKGDNLSSQKKRKS